MDIKPNYKIELVSFEDLPKEIEKIGLSNNGCGKEEAHYLLIHYKTKNRGILIDCYSDAMEPEDARFTRDLAWIKDALECAYEKGLSFR